MNREKREQQQRRKRREGRPDRCNMEQKGEIQVTSTVANSEHLFSASSGQHTLRNCACVHVCVRVCVCPYSP